MSRTVRIYWKARNGRIPVNLNWPGVINTRSVVVVTACEYNPLLPINTDIPVPGRPLPLDKADRLRFVGAADVWVSNIAPHGPAGADPGGVTFIVHVDWDSPLPFVTDVTVLDPTEQVLFE